jgi:hypothetical protein
VERVAYTTAEGRQDLLDGLGQAVTALEDAVASVGAAYEEVDERTADRLEDELFRPVQAAYGQAKRTRSGFAQRVGMDAGAPAAGSGAGPSRGARAAIEAAVAAVMRADAELVELQDSMLPVEVGDQELRAGIAEIRTTIADLPARAREIERVLGR